MTYSIIFSAQDHADTTAPTLDAARAAIATVYGRHPSEVGLDDRSSSDGSIEQYSAWLANGYRPVAPVATITQERTTTTCTAAVRGSSGFCQIGIEYTVDADGTHHEVCRPLMREIFVGYGLIEGDPIGLAIVRRSHDGEMTEWRTDRRGTLAPCARPAAPPLLNLPNEEHGHPWGDPINVPSTEPTRYYVCDREITAAEAVRYLTVYTITRDERREPMRGPRVGDLIPADIDRDERVDGSVAGLDSRYHLRGVGLVPLWSVHPPEVLMDACCLTDTCSAAVVIAVDPHLLQLTLRDTDTAAYAWAAAASTARAMVPSLVAQALIATGGDLLAAALRGSAAAAQQHEVDRAGGHTGPEPRGLEAEIRGGRGEALVWRSETHVIRLGGSPGAWSLQIWSDAPLADSRRVRAALVSVWQWRSVEDYDVLCREAALAGLTGEQLEAQAQAASDAEGDVEPLPGWEERAVDRARAAGLFASGTETRS